MVSAALTVFGIILTYCLHRKSVKMIDKIYKAVLYTLPGTEEQREKLLDDFHRTKKHRGAISERERGGIDWKEDFQDVVDVSDHVKIEKQKKKQ